MRGVRLAASRRWRVFVVLCLCVRVEVVVWCVWWTCGNGRLWCALVSTCVGDVRLVVGAPLEFALRSIVLVVVDVVDFLSFRDFFLVNIL